VLRAKLKQVLRGNYGYLRHAGLGRANQRPQRPLANRTHVSLDGATFGLAGASHQPCVVSLSCVPV